MRTRFHFDMEAAGSHDPPGCKAMVPLGPLRTFRHDRRHVATRCPSCGELATVDIDTASRMLSGWTDVATLVERARTDEEVDRFEDSVRLANSWPHHRQYRGRVGGPERCVHCDKPIAVPQELAPGSSASVRCVACGATTHLVPPPRWLAEQCPTWTHLLLPAEPPTVRCDACGAATAVGPQVPPTICCDACGVAIEVTTTPEVAAEIDRPRFSARLALTSAAVVAEARGAISPLTPAILTLLVAVGGVWFVAEAEARGTAVGSAGAVALGLVSSLLVLLGVLWLVLSLRGRARRRSLIAELQRLEAGTGAAEGPYR